MEPIPYPKPVDCRDIPQMFPMPSHFTACLRMLNSANLALTVTKSRIPKRSTRILGPQISQLLILTVKVFALLAELRRKRRVLTGVNVKNACENYVTGIDVKTADTIALCLVQEVRTVFLPLTSSNTNTG